MKKKKKNTKNILNDKENNVKEKKGLQYFKCV